MFELIRVERCTSTINDTQCNACNHIILCFKNRGQTCHVNIFGIPIWRPITKTNERW